jgi:hypothetical protein
LLAVVYYKFAHFSKSVNYRLPLMSLAHDMSGFVAHDLSGLRWLPLEVPDETDRDATGDPEDAI